MGLFKWIQKKQFAHWVENAKDIVRYANKKGIRMSKFSSNPEEKALFDYYTQYDLVRKTWWLTLATWALAIATIIFIFLGR
jgi:hypothetical protein